MNTVFEKISMKAVKGAERIFDVVASEDIENGTVGYIEGLESGYDHVYTFHKGEKAGCVTVIAGAPEWDYDESKITNQRRDKFVIEAGVPFRGYVLAVTDEIGLTKAGFTSGSAEQVKVGAKVTVDGTTGKFVAAASVTSPKGLVGTIMRSHTLGGQITTTAHNYGYTQVIYEIKIDKVEVTA